MRQKRGQLTLFIIIGIVIIASILTLLFVYNPSFLDSFRPIVVPDTFEYCVKQGVDGIVDDLALTAGFTGSYFNKTYQGVAVPYACYTEEYYKPCVVQVPFLEEEFKDSFLVLAEEEIENCFNDYVEEFTRQGYAVSAGEIEVELELQMDKLDVAISAPLVISDGNATTTLEDYTLEIPTEIYNVLMLAILVGLFLMSSSINLIMIYLSIELVRPAACLDPL